MKLDYRLKLNRYLCGFALLLLLLLPQISFASLVPTVATINGNPISIEDFNWALGRAQRDMVRQGQQIDNDVLDSLKKTVLQGLFRQELLYLESQAHQVSVQQAQIEAELNELKSRFQTPGEFYQVLDNLQVSEDALRSQIRRGIAIKELVSKVFVEAVQLEEGYVENYFREHRADFLQQELLRASHILIRVSAGAGADEKAKAKKKIRKLKKQLEDGEDFAVLAKTSSECPSSERGGDLGYFQRGQMVPEFDQAAFALPVGEVSDIVETEFGYHLIKSVEHLPEKEYSFAEVKEDLTTHLTIRQAQQDAAKLAAERLETAEVKILLDDLK